MNDINLQQAKPRNVPTFETIEINLSRHLVKIMFKGVAIAILISGCAASPLHMAAERNDVSQVKSLLTEGTDINIRDDDGATPLHLAAKEGHLKVVELLLAKGAEVNARTRYSITPLHWGAYYDHIEVVELLLSKGADVDAKGNNSVTPLYFAVQEGNIEIVKLLIANGANVNAKDKESITPLHVAAINGHQEIVELLLAKGTDVNTKNDNGWTPLYLAAQEGHIETVKLLLSKGADVNARDKHSRTPLHLQGYNANVKVVELLLANGADVNAKDDLGQTPLDDATKYRNDAIVDLLIKSGAKRDKILILPFADCPDAHGSGKAFTNVIYATFFEKLKYRYDVVDISIVEQELLKLGQGYTVATAQDEVARRFGAVSIIAGELTVWKPGGWTKMPVVGFTVRCRSVATSTIRWTISHCDSVWIAALERRTPEIAAREVIEKAIKEDKIY